MTTAAAFHAIHARPRRALAALGLFLVLAGAAINWLSCRRQQGFDFVWPYVLARMMAVRRDAYDPGAIREACREWAGVDRSIVQAYPPSTGIVTLPLAALPLETARTVYFVLSLTVLLGGCAALARALAPAAPRHALLLTCGIVACAACVRWGFSVLQPAPLQAGLLCLFAAALLRGRARSAVALGTIAIALKFTNGLPFVALAAIRRQWGVAGAVLGLWVALNAAGFAWLGGAPAVAGYRAHLARTERPDEINAPNPHVPFAVMRLDWVYLVNGATRGAGPARAFALLLSAACALWLVVGAARARRVARRPELLAAYAAPVCCLSLLWIYHNHYEAAVLVAPAVAWAFCPAARRGREAALAAVPVLLFFGLYPTAQVQNLVLGRFGPTALAYLKCAGGAIVALAFAASMAAAARVGADRRGAWEEAAGPAPPADGESTCRL